MKQFIRFCIPVLIPVVAAIAEDQPVAPSGAMATEAYSALGSKITTDNRLDQLGWTDEQVDAFVSGVRAALRGSPVPMSAAGESLMAQIGRRVQELDKDAADREFGAVAFTKPGYLRKYLKDMRTRLQLQASDSGLVFGIKVSGHGARPEPDDVVIVSYKMVAADGKSEIPGLARDRERSRVKDMLPGLQEALQMMSVGSGAVLILPPDLSYGEGEWPAGAERGTPLIVTLVLHEIVEKP